MKASQLVYTSWKNGNSQKKGYMVYSKTEDITDSEVEDIKTIMRYIPPRGLNPAPTEEEISTLFPYNFAYFKLNSGRACIALSTYLGKDYSNRFGNYIIYALVVDDNQLKQYPYEFFGEPFIKTSMTEDELNAESPVPPLETLEIEEVGNVLSDDILADFVKNNEDQAAYAISAALQARKEKVPFYINDTRENIILWIAIITRIFPVTVAKKIYFSSYVFDHDRLRYNDTDIRALSLDVQGVRPDANNFSYNNAATSTKQIVMDSLNGIVTEDVAILEIAKDLSEDFTIGMDDIDSFGRFLEKESYTEYSYDLSYAYEFFKLNKYKSLNYRKGIKPFLEFGINHLTQETNMDSAIELIKILQNEYEVMEMEDVAEALLYSYQNAGFMSYSIHSILFDLLFKMSEESSDEDAPFKVLKQIQNTVPASYEDLLNYFVSGDLQSQIQLYMTDNEDINCNLFFSRFVMRNYSSNDARCKKTKELVASCIKNIARLDITGDALIKLLEDAEHDKNYIRFVIREYNFNADQSKGKIPVVISKWLSESHTVEESSRLLNTLMEDESTIQIAVNIGGAYIRSSKNKYEAFWNFYINNKDYFAGVGAVSLDYMLDAYVSAELEKEDSEEILRRIDHTYLVNYKNLAKILQPLEDESVKSLVNTSEYTLQKAADLAMAAKKQHSFVKIVAVANAGRGTKDIEKKSSFADAMDMYPVTIIDFGKKDYEEYLDTYMYKYIRMVSSQDELIDFFDRLCDKNREDEFYLTLNDCLKKERKKEKQHWLRLMVWISVILIQGQNTSDAVRNYKTYYYRYLRKLSPEDFDDIQTTVFKIIPGERSAVFFEKALEKESLLDKFGGVLKKKI